MTTTSVQKPSTALSEKMSSNASVEGDKPLPTLDLLEGDDEFEEFPVEGSN